MWLGGCFPKTAAIATLIETSETIWNALAKHGRYFPHFHLLGLSKRICSHGTKNAPAHRCLCVPVQELLTPQPLRPARQTTIFLWPKTIDIYWHFILGWVNNTQTTSWRFGLVYPIHSKHTLTFSGWPFTGHHLNTQETGQFTRLLTTHRSMVAFPNTNELHIPVLPPQRLTLGLDIFKKTSKSSTEPTEAHGIQNVQQPSVRSLMMQFWESLLPNSIQASLTGKIWLCPEAQGIPQCGDVQRCSEKPNLVSPCIHPPGWFFTRIRDAQIHIFCRPRIDVNICNYVIYVTCYT